MSEGMATPPDRRTLLLLDVIVVARRDPHVAEILQRGLKTYLEAMTSANDTGVALGFIDPALETGELARLFALLTFGTMVFAALDERPPSDDAFRRFTDLLLQSAGGAGDDDEPAALGPRPCAREHCRTRGPRPSREHRRSTRRRTQPPQGRDGGRPLTRARPATPQRTIRRPRTLRRVAQPQPARRLRWSGTPLLSRCAPRAPRSGSCIPATLHALPDIEVVGEPTPLESMGIPLVGGISVFRFASRPRPHVKKSDTPRTVRGL